jgi:hypothetical protein
MKAPETVLSEIKSHLHNGQTIESVAEFLRKEAIKEGGAARLDYPKGGFSLMYTTNTNYGQGIKNGYGAGLYASLRCVGFCKTVKII